MPILGIVTIAGLILAVLCICLLFVYSKECAARQEKSAVRWTKKCLVQYSGMGYSVISLLKEAGWHIQDLSSVDIELITNSILTEDGREPSRFIHGTVYSVPVPA